MRGTLPAESIKGHENDLHERTRSRTMTSELSGVPLQQVSTKRQSPYQEAMSAPDLRDAPHLHLLGCG